jgi:hypothetical protein
MHQYVSLAVERLVIVAEERGWIVIVTEVYTGGVTTMGVIRSHHHLEQGQKVTARTESWPSAIPTVATAKDCFFIKINVCFVLEISMERSHDPLACKNAKI